MYDTDFEDREHVSLCEALDRVLNSGAVITGDITISVADIDLIYLGLHVILTSIETAREKLNIPTPQEYFCRPNGGTT